MVSDLDKYRAQNLQVAGFCFMTPLGRLILNVPEYESDALNLKWFLYSVFAILLFIVGIIVMVRGEVHLEERKQK